MVKFAIFFSITVILASSCSESKGSSNDEWNLFKLEHGKSYDSPLIDTLRRSIFMRNKVAVEKFNAEESEKLGYRRGLNHLSDYTQAEVDRLKGFKVNERDHQRLQNSPQAQRFLDSILNDNTIDVPDELDWRDVPGRVSRVKDQGQCGSCWAFATTGVLEGQEAIRNKSLITGGILTELSEQNLVDCDYTDAYGCEGGWMKSALELVNQEGGIDSEETYPYEAQDMNCRFKSGESVMTDSGAAILPEGDENKLKKIVAKFGPVAVAIDVEDSFEMYEDGILNTEDCGNSLKQLDHGVLVVGYGKDKKWGDFWIVKNSWGSSWGKDGYIKMARNRQNQCGIATVATIPTF